MIDGDSLCNILYIDLTKRRFWTRRKPELFTKYLGGAGVAAQLLHDECPQGTDALESDNPIVLAVGPLTGLYPLASKTVAMFKSPLTNNLGESHCGGRSAISLRLAGYGAMVITGASSIPIYVSVADGGVRFLDASTLWGMESGFTAARIMRENGESAGHRTIMRIGRGGEQLVRYACVTTETYRHFGRLGLGAVFGSKKLKGLVISGKRSLPVENRKQYRQVYDEIYQAATQSELMRKYHDLGTAGNILPLSTMKALPTRNLQQASSEHEKAFSGEALAESFLGRRIACSHCPVGCIHLAALREPYATEPYFYKTSMISYDYEPIYAIGTMLGGADPRGMLRLMDEIEKAGIDVMSVGVVLAWATECFEKGIISERDTEGIRLSWGDYEQYGKAVSGIVDRSNTLFDAMANGVAYASGKYGGEEFALAFGGNEMPGYHTGPAAYAGYLAGARHSHLDNAGYSIDQKNFGKEPIAPAELARQLVIEESWRQILSSLVVCFFARGIYTKKVVISALAAAGIRFTEDEIDSIGRDIYQKKFEYKMMHGFRFADLRIPKRVLETPAPGGMVDHSYIENVIQELQKLVVK